MMNEWKKEWKNFSIKKLIQGVTKVDEWKKENNENYEKKIKNCQQNSEEWNSGNYLSLNKNFVPKKILKNLMNEENDETWNEWKLLMRIKLIKLKKGVILKKYRINENHLWNSHTKR